MHCEAGSLFTAIGMWVRGRSSWSSRAEPICVPVCAVRALTHKHCRTLGQAVRSLLALLTEGGRRMKAGAGAYGTLSQGMSYEEDR